MPLKVQGKPYEADCEWVLVKKLPSGQTRTRITSGMVARDSSGRRLEQYEVQKDEGSDERPVWTANIYDPVSQTLNYIDLKSGTTWTSFPVATRIGEYGVEIPTIEIEGMTADLSFDLRRSADGKLGERVMEGMCCSGYYRDLGVGSIEYWIAEGLEATVWSRTGAGDLEITTRIFNILRSEPDPLLFVVPPLCSEQIQDGYMVGDSGLIIRPAIG